MGNVALTANWIKISWSTKGIKINGKIEILK